MHRKFTYLVIQNITYGDLWNILHVNTAHHHLNTYQIKQQCWNISNSVIHPTLTHSLHVTKTFQSLLFCRKQALSQNSHWPSNFGEQQKPCPSDLSESTDFTPFGDNFPSYRCSSFKKPMLTKEGGNKSTYCHDWFCCPAVQWLGSSQRWKSGVVEVLTLCWVKILLLQDEKKKVSAVLSIITETLWLVDETV